MAHGIQRVAVGLSGGVDSAVAAALLLEQGLDVAGVTMRIWDGRPLPAETGRHACYGPGEEQDIADAARIARLLGIPFHVVDLAEAYNRDVLDFLVRGYRGGMTPNPCVYCNRHVKFGGIPRQLRDIGIPVDSFATGHYARVVHDDARGRYALKKASDRRKDQSYFLYLLTQEQLATTRFPLGDLTKSQVRELARKRGLPVADKTESQDFISGGYHQLFEDIPCPGPILDEKGRVLGEHDGTHRYTVGQRRGLGVAAGTPLYVLALDPDRNAVIVGPETRLYRRRLLATGVNWIAIGAPAKPIRAAARVRYRHHEAPATISPAGAGAVEVTFDEPQRAATPGQAVVFYEGDTVLGGGTIASVTD